MLFSLVTTQLYSFENSDDLGPFCGCSAICLTFSVRFEINKSLVLKFQCSHKHFESFKSCVSASLDKDTFIYYGILVKKDS